MKYKLLCDHESCYFCGIKNCKKSKDKRFRNLIEIHHIKERNQGGSNKPDNLIPLCSNCHSLVHEHQIEILGWFNVGYCYKLKWIDKDGKEHLGSN